MRTLTRSVLSLGLGILTVFLLGAAVSFSVGNTETVVFDGTSNPVSGIASVATGSGAGSNDEVDVTVTYGDPEATDTKTIKPGDPLYKSYSKIKKITAKKHSSGGGNINITVEVVPSHGTTMVSANWRTTETEAATPLSRTSAGVIVFGLSADAGSTSTIALMNGTSVVQEKTIDSSNGWSGSFYGTSIVVRAASGTGSLSYSLVDESGS